MKLILTPTRNASGVARMTAVVAESNTAAPNRRYLASGEVEVEAPAGTTIAELRHGARQMGAEFALFTINQGGR